MIAVLAFGVSFDCGRIRSTATSAPRWTRTKRSPNSDFERLQGIVNQVLDRRRGLTADVFLVGAETRDGSSIGDEFQFALHERADVLALCESRVRSGRRRNRRVQDGRCLLEGAARAAIVARV